MGMLYLISFSESVLGFQAIPRLISVVPTTYYLMGFLFFVSLSFLDVSSIRMLASSVRNISTKIVTRWPQVKYAVYCFLSILGKGSCIRYFCDSINYPKLCLRQRSICFAVFVLVVRKEPSKCCFYGLGLFCVKMDSLIVASSL